MSVKFVITSKTGTLAVAPKILLLQTVIACGGVEPTYLTKNCLYVPEL